MYARLWLSMVPGSDSLFHRMFRQLQPRTGGTSPRACSTRILVIFRLDYRDEAPTDPSCPTPA